LAFDRQKLVGPGRPGDRLLRAERKLDIPEAEVEPGARVYGTDRLKPVETVDSALEPDGRPVQHADRRKSSLRALETYDGAVLCIVRHSRHVHSVGRAGTGP